MIQLKDFDHISFSSIDLYELCPFAWYQKYIEQIIDPEGNHYSAFGKHLHHVLELWGKDRIAGKEHSLFQILDNYRSLFPHDSFSSSELRRKFFREGELMIERFFDTEGHTVPKKIEHITNLILPDLPKIEVHIDRIDGLTDHPQTWCVQDYKTGKIYSVKEAQDHLQLSIYGMAIKQDFGDFPRDYMYKFLKHPAKRTGYVIRKTTRSEEDLKKAEERIYTFWQNVNDGKFDPVRKLNFCDMFCYYRKKGICEKRTVEKGWDL